MAVRIRANSEGDSQYEEASGRICEVVVGRDHDAENAVNMGYTISRTLPHQGRTMGNSASAHHADHAVWRLGMAAY